MTMRGTATDKLADVIQMLRFVQKTGVLTLQRENADHSLEEGSLFLRDGQIADAMIGNLHGADALKKLSGWTKCYFVFQDLPPSAPSPFASQGPATPWPRTTDALRDTGAPTGTDSVVPYRAHQFQFSLPDFERLGLSRVHRQLFLLADGQRSITVLAKLLGRHPHEVLLMLNDMEDLQLLQHL